MIMVVAVQVKHRIFVYFENGLSKETEILVETNFRLFVFYFTFQNIASGLYFFSITLLAQVKIHQHVYDNIYSCKYNVSSQM